MRDTSAMVGGVTLADADRERLRELLRRHGERRMAAALAVNRSTLARAAAGMPLRRSIARLLQLSLREGEH